ncbi:hypothetical protein [Paenibacillus sp. YYML68]|uniref:hypothetical protein n=1 Tax=Paenibacillus sp. YYML68 TaxID=2909250 RepID=UPI002492C8BB|nr:hypothetical protein [Paenibacillus sp. YYML68]
MQERYTQLLQLKYKSRSISMRKRSVIITSICLILLLFYIGSVQDRSKVENTISGFYQGMIKNDYSESHKYFNIKHNPELSLEGKQSIIAQSLIEDRHWYGEINGTSIKWILWAGFSRKLILVNVRYTHDNIQIKEGTDKILIENLNDEWVITNYKSGAPIPQMP